MTNNLQIVERGPDQMTIERLRSLLARKRNELQIARAFIEQLQKENARLENLAQRCAGLKFQAEAESMFLRAALVACRACGETIPADAPVKPGGLCEGCWSERC